MMAVGGQTAPQMEGRPCKRLLLCGTPILVEVSLAKRFEIPRWGLRGETARHCAI
jgi:hypothetical protein